jgi:hypothetical protein
MSRSICASQFRSLVVGRVGGWFVRRARFTRFACGSGSLRTTYMSNCSHRFNQNRSQAAAQKCSNRLFVVWILHIAPGVLSYTEPVTLKRPAATQYFLVFTSLSTLTVFVMLKVKIILYSQTYRYFLWGKDHRATFVIVFETNKSFRSCLEAQILRVSSDQ